MQGQPRDVPWPVVALCAALAVLCWCSIEPRELAQLMHDQEHAPLERQLHDQERRIDELTEAVGDIRREINR